MWHRNENTYLELSDGDALTARATATYEGDEAK